VCLISVSFFCAARGVAAGRAHHASCVAVLVAPPSIGSLHTIQPLYQHRGQPVLDETAALRAWLRKRPADGSDFLFTGQKGGKLGRTQFFRNFQAIAESAGLEVQQRHPHVLKHSLASHLVSGNANLALIRQALGHRSISSTMQYIGTSDGQAAEALQKALMGLF
jgi:integrase